MAICALCEGQLKKRRQSKPHEQLVPVDEPRVFKGAGPRGFTEQDFQCRECSSKFTWSTDPNDLPWTLWRA